MDEAAIQIYKPTVGHAIGEAGDYYIHPTYLVTGAVEKPYLTPESMWKDELLSGHSPQDRSCAL